MASVTWLFEHNQTVTDGNRIGIVRGLDAIIGEDLEPHPVYWVDWLSGGFERVREISLKPSAPSRFVQVQSEMDAKRLTSDRIAEIRARLEAATPGPWRIEYDGDTWEDGRSDRWPVYINGSQNEIVFDLDYSDNLDANAEFAAHAPTDIAALLSHITTLDAELAAAREEIGRLRKVADQPCSGKE